MANINDMNFDAVWTAYYSLFRADADVPTSSDDEYTVGMRLANEAINYWSNYEGTFWKELYDTNQVDGSGTQTITTGTTTYSAPSNFREAGGFVKIKNSSGNQVQAYEIIDPSDVQFRGDQDEYCYFTNHPHYYSTGTASQSTTTITGSGTTWTSAMVGMQFIFATGETATITAFGSTTSLTADTSQTVGSTTYHIDTTGVKLHINPAPTSNLNGLYIDYAYYKYPTLFTNGTTRTEMGNPMFIAHRMLYNQLRASRNPYMDTALRDAEDAIKKMQVDSNWGNAANTPVLTDNSGMTFGA